MSRSIREKGTVTKAKSLFVGSFEISSKKSVVALKIAENFCHKNSMARGWADTRGGGTPLRWLYGYQPQRVLFFNRTSIVKQS